ncbi:ALDH-like protein [Armillaria gallica]|uniref:ALDH-like protein n=1 Tax=Armillaria gallica TaxID=47427 RepID=A0A2H3D9I4_ARMGA|nr:ALDH-like protein [Armillaria gallica]
MYFQRVELGALFSLEMGKIKTEGVGEVQEFIDICDYAVGLSRMMSGRVVTSERVGHSILEVPNPLGVIGVLTVFNFTVAVYGWNLSFSLAAGNATAWESSHTTPLCARDKIWCTETFPPILNVAIFDHLDQAIEWNNSVPQGLSSSLWTRDLRNAGQWIGPNGSDAGIVNINVGNSGAEISAAFGGNKVRAAEN